MRTRAALGGIFASVSILIVGWQAGSAVILAQSSASVAASAGSSGSSAAATNSAGTATGTGASAAPTPTGTAAATGSSTGAVAATGGSTGAVAKKSGSGSFTGTSVSTRYGSVQVGIVVASGKITDVVAVHLTDSGGHSVQLSANAAPILRSEVLQSQSAQVSTVGGATYTSEAYLTSLQSAIDQAKL